jgi:hypothetical protein
MAGQSQRGLLGNVVRDVGTPRNGEMADDPVDGGQGGDAPTKARRRTRKAPITEKGKGRNLKIPDSVFVRLELEAIRRGWDKSKLATHLLNQALPTNIKIVVGEEQAAAS